MKKIIVLFFLICFVSCLPSKKDKDDNTVEENISLKNVAQQNPKFEVIKPSFTKEIENWAAYRNVNLFIEKFQNISPNEALNNALELQELTQALKENVELEILNIPSFQARLNVLHNEVLRLSDMTYISAIKADEVNLQVEKMLTIYSSINSKINTVFTLKKFESEIKVKDIFIGLDTTKLDTTSLRTIRDKKLKINEFNKIRSKKN